MKSKDELNSIKVDKVKKIKGRNFMRKISFVICVAMAFTCFAACTCADESKSSEASSEFTANIDKYWQDHDFR